MNRFFENTGFVPSQEFSEEELSRQLYHFPIVKDFACYCVFNIIKKGLDLKIPEEELLQHMIVDVDVDEVHRISYTKKAGFTYEDATVLLTAIKHNT